MHTFMDAYFLNNFSIDKSEIPLIKSIIPLIKLNYCLSISHYLYLIGKKEESTRELEWVFEFIQYYKKNPSPVF